MSPGDLEGLWLLQRRVNAMNQRVIRGIEVASYSCSLLRNKLTFESPFKDGFRDASFRGSFDHGLVASE